MKKIVAGKTQGCVFVQWLYGWGDEEGTNAESAPHTSVLRFRFPSCHGASRPLQQPQTGAIFPLVTHSQNGGCVSSKVRKKFVVDHGRRACNYPSSRRIDGYLPGTAAASLAHHVRLEEPPEWEKKRKTDISASRVGCPTHPSKYSPR